MPVFAKIEVNGSAGGDSAWVPLNQYQTPFNVAFGVTKAGTGDVEYKIQHTFDNVLANASAASIFTHADVTAATGDADGNYAYPVAAIRCHVTAASGASTLQFYVRQAGY